MCCYEASAWSRPTAEMGRILLVSYLCCGHLPVRLLPARCVGCFLTELNSRGEFEIDASKCAVNRKKKYHFLLWMCSSQSLEALLKRKKKSHSIVSMVCLNSMRDLLKLSVAGKRKIVNDGQIRNYRR